MKAVVVERVGSFSIKEVAEPTLAAVDVLRTGARQIAIEQEHGPDKPDLERMAGEARQQLNQAWAQAGVALDDLLQGRIDTLFQRMWLHL